MVAKGILVLVINLQKIKSRKMASNLWVYRAKKWHAQEESNPQPSDP